MRQAHLAYGTVTRDDTLQNKTRRVSLSGRVFFFFLGGGGEECRSSNLQRTCISHYDAKVAKMDRLFFFFDTIVGEDKEPVGEARGGGG